jgi:16S rRNA G527 N7-methylase RsmG
MAFDCFTSRATLPLPPTLALAAELVVPGGQAFLWKGSRREEEMSRDQSWRESWDLADQLVIGDGRTAVSKFLRKW